MKMEVFALSINFKNPISPATFDTLLARLELEKQQRLRRFYRMEDRLRGLYAELLIRRAIIQKTGLKNEEITFNANDYGKPFLNNRNDFQFNLSHSGIWVVGVIDPHPVGIDIEQIQPIDLDISENYFSPDEHHDLMSKADKFDYFFTLWSLKESYIKILGKGLSHPLNAFSIKFTGPDQIIIRVDGKPIEEIYFKQYLVDNDYKMAVCATHPHFPLQVEMVDEHELTSWFLHL